MLLLNFQSLSGAVPLAMLPLPPQPPLLDRAKFQQVVPALKLSALSAPEWRPVAGSWTLGWSQRSASKLEKGLRYNFADV